MAYYPPPQGSYPPPYYPPQPRYSGCVKFIFYLLSFFIPIVGLVLGLVYLSQGDPESKSLGTACLIISIVTIVLGCCLGLGIGVLPVLLELIAESGY